MGEFVSDPDIAYTETGHGVPKSCVEAVNAFYNNNRSWAGMSREDVHTELVAVVLAAQREYKREQIKTRFEKAVKGGYAYLPTMLNEPPDLSWLEQESIRKEWAKVQPEVKLRFVELKRWLGW